MWIASKLGFYSVVLKENGIYHVRARRREDLHRLREAACMPSLEVSTRAGTDYQCRFLVSPGEWATLSRALSSSVDYGNFKNEIDRLEPWRASVYSWVWQHLAQHLPE